MERWMEIHSVTTREEWEAKQPKPDPYDGWSFCMALSKANQTPTIFDRLPDGQSIRYRVSIGKGQ